MVKSIDTFYNGNYHRSRLEARWAYFFKELGISYEYEPTGFINSDREMYLPDFYLPDTYLRENEKGVYIEIKPDVYDISSITDYDWFEKQLILFKGSPLNYEGFDINTTTPFKCRDYDHSMELLTCDKCNKSSIIFPNHNNFQCSHCYKGKYIYSKVKDAAFLAAHARFEHNKH